MAGRFRRVPVLAQVGGCRRLYPVEVSALGLLPHDGMARDGALFDHSQADPERTLVLACCDPAVGILAAALMRRWDFRLIVLSRSSRSALDLLAKGLLHAAGVHLARSDQVEGNAAAIRRTWAQGLPQTSSCCGLQIGRKGLLWLQAPG